MATFRQPSQVEAFNKNYSNRAFAILLDLTDEEGFQRTVEQLVSRFKRIDVLVNNAGIGFAGAIEETSMEEARKVFEANFFGALKLTQTVLPYMRKEKNGHIVQISSHGGIKAFAGFGIYNASKFALEGFSEALAQEAEPLGIKVTIVEPGPFRTNFAGKGLGEAAKVIADYAETAGTFRAKLKGIDGKQEGHPVKASKAIIDLVYSENPTLRLPLGRISLKSLEMKLNSVKSDLEKHQETAERVVYD